MRGNYLFGPFVGETIYELNYFVGHAIYLRKLNPQNKIIVLTRKENFDLYGRYATTLLPLPLDKELVPRRFGCENMRANLFDEIVKKFQVKYHKQIKVHDHFFPKINTYLKDLRWYYPRAEVDFDFKPRPKNTNIAKSIAGSRTNFIVSDFHTGWGNKILSYLLLPTNYLFEELDLSEAINASPVGVLIELIRLCKYVHADIDSLSGRLAILMSKPLITKREFIDAQDLNPINPYGSIVIGCEKLSEGIQYLEKKHEDNI